MATGSGSGSWKRHSAFVRMQARGYIRGTAASHFKETLYFVSFIYFYLKKPFLFMWPYDRLIKLPSHQLNNVHKDSKDYYGFTKGYPCNMIY